MSNYFGFIRLRGDYDFTPDTFGRFGLDFCDGICAFEGMSSDEVMEIVDGIIGDMEQTSSSELADDAIASVKEAAAPFKRDIQQDYCYAIGWSSWRYGEVMLMALKEDLSKSEIASICGDYVLLTEPQV